MEPLTLPRRFLRNCRRTGGAPKIADSTGAELSGRALLLRTLTVRRLLARRLRADERFVGVLLPPTVGGVLVNAALPLMRRVTVNLNYTMPPDLLNACIARSGVRHVITSRRVIEKFKLRLDAEIIYLEDLRDEVTIADKVVAFVQSLAPVAWLDKSFGLAQVDGDDLLAVMFTSGSTNRPKGVMLSYDNVASQIDGIQQVLQMSADDVALGVMPLFHAYGYTATMWTVLTLPPRGVYHFDPRDGEQIGKLCGRHGVTVLMATPTFLRIYMRRVRPEDFRTLDVVFASSERLTKELSDAFEKRFGLRPLDAYGCTELSPIVSLNVPPGRSPDAPGGWTREGTVGRPLPGVRTRVVHPETGAAVRLGGEGLLLVAGPNVMKGYLDDAALTAEVIRDGWYVTGDVATLDEEGFIRITGRESRFSKIGGEMVSHTHVEELLHRLIGGDEDQLRAAVTAVSDPFKGERLVVLHTPLDKAPERLCRELSAAGVPNLWIPSPDSFREVPHIPLLGSGKLDLRGLREMAAAVFAK